MQAARFASPLVVSLAVISACSDDVSTPLAASWLEWADSVTAGVSFGVRVSGLMSETPTSLRIHVNVDRDTITIEPYSVERPCRHTCPDVLRGFDTLVWVPVIAATTPRTVVIRATSPLEPLQTPWPLRTFGTITVSVDTPVVPHMRSVGMASGSGDTAGCYLVRPLSAAPVYVSADQPPAWAPGFVGFVFGRTDPVFRSACRDDAFVIQVDSIIYMTTPRLGHAPR